MASLALITGATGAIGTQAALLLARQGWNLILLNRNPKKTAQLVTDLRKAAPNIQLHTYHCDLADSKALAATTESILQKHPKIDALLNNAAVLLQQQQLAPNGYDAHYQVNVVAPYQITQALLPALAKGKATVVNVASGVVFMGKALQVDQLPHPTKQGLSGAYTQSKKAVTLLTRQQAKQYADQGIRVFAVDPGVNQSDMTQNHAPFIFRWFYKLLPTPDKGAKRLTLPFLRFDFQAPNGSLIVNAKPKALPKKWATTQNEHRLWKLLEEATVVA